MKKTAGELAEIVGGRLYGDSTVEIDDVRSAESAGPSHITFARGIYAEHIEEMKAGVILVDELPAHYTKNLIVVPDCRRSFGQLVDLYHPESRYTPGIHPTAVVSDKAVIGKDVCIMPYAVIDDGARIGDGTVIFPYTYVGKNAQIGKNCEINPGCVIHENSVLGDRVVLRAHAVVGGQGFGFSTDEKGHHHHIRQLQNALLVRNNHHALVFVFTQLAEGIHQHGKTPQVNAGLRLIINGQLGLTRQQRGNLNAFQFPARQ